MTAQGDTIYLRPFGCLGPADATAQIDQGFALPLAGGPYGFTLLEIIRRGSDGSVQKRTVRISDELSLARLIGREALEQLTGPRATMAGLAFDHPHIMGVLNVTPDSFSDGGRFVDVDKAVQAGLAMTQAGASIVDVGGESTRPGADEVSVDDELARVVPVIEGLAAEGVTAISIDTRKSEVMKAACEAGAAIINDVSALTYDPDSLAVAKDLGVPVILMHAQGTPQTMQDDPQYGDVVLDVYDYLAERVSACVEAGFDVNKLIVDPGIGFGKTLHHNVQLLSGMAIFHGLGIPVLLGASRKSFISGIVGDLPPEARLPGSLATVLTSVFQGIQIVRVHDVSETAQILGVFDAIANQD